MNARPTFQEHLLECLSSGPPTRGMMRDFATLLREGQLDPSHPDIAAIRVKLEDIRQGHPVLRHRWRARLALEALDEASRRLDASRLGGSLNA